MNWTDLYTAGEMRQIVQGDSNYWPANFLGLVHKWFADELLDDWLNNHSEDQYRDEIVRIVDEMTGGYEDNNGEQLQLNFKY